MTDSNVCAQCNAVVTVDTLFCPSCGALLMRLDDEPEKPKPKFLLRGTRFADRYEIVDVLGQGGMGVVYKAVDQQRREMIALKTISEEALSRPNVKEEIYKGRFQREAQAISLVKHPHIVQVYDVGEYRDQAYIAMEYLKGQTLEDLLASYGPVPPDTARGYALQAAEALAHIHDRGIIHRDMKPLNIMILQDNNVKVMDFGLVKMVTSGEHHQTFTRTGQLVGTPQYLCPELILGKPVDLRADIFSFGIVLYEMLTARNPFDSENISNIMHQIVSLSPPAPSEIVPNIPAQMDMVTMRAMNKDPRLRYQSMHFLTADLRKNPEFFEKEKTKRRL